MNTAVSDVCLLLNHAQTKGLRDPYIHRDSKNVRYLIFYSWRNLSQYSYFFWHAISW